jgi:hypothetical protein
MRSFLLLVLLCFSVTASAAGFKLQFADPTQIVLNDSDWSLVSHSESYDLYLAQEMIGAGTHQSTKMHSMVVFHRDPGVMLGGLPVPIKRIFSFGLMDCSQGRLTLLNDWFVDNTNQVIYNQNHEPGEYLVDLSIPNTPRNDAYLAVCKRGS